MSINSEKRESILKKVRALLQMTVENGATESEAMVAAEKAMRMMEEYSLSYSDVQEIKDEKWGTRTWTGFASYSNRRDKKGYRVKVYHECFDCLHWIGQFTNTRFVVEELDLKCFGTGPDTEFGRYLAVIIRTAMEVEWTHHVARLKEKTGQHGKTLRKAFMLGMASRINQRLKALVEERGERQQVSTGRELVVVKNALLNQHFAQAYPEVEAINRSYKIKSEAALRAGFAAGDKVGFGRPLGSGESAKRLT